MIVLKITDRNFKKIVKIAAKAIKAGKVAIFPTDTVYGLTADATDKKAVERIFKIKKRDKGKPVPIFVRDIRAAKKISEINKKQERFLKGAWPGKVTAVLRLRKKCMIYGSGRRTVALRVPNYKFVDYLLLAAKVPLVGTSANISGKPESTKIRNVISQFENQKLKPDSIIDAGNLKRSLFSTVIDLTSPRMKILRKGAVKIKING